MWRGSNLGNRITTTSLEEKSVSKQILNDTIFIWDVSSSSNNKGTITEN